MRTGAAGQSTPPLAVFGLPAHDGERHLAEALESLLAQTRGDFLVAIVDDCSTDRTAEIAARYAGLDPRVAYERNDRRLGLVRSWRRAFELAGRLAPDAPYFAWASDHDVWHPRWLELLAAELDAHPEAVLAYPRTVRIDDHGSEYPTREQGFETAGVASPLERVRRTARELTAAGEVVYGLARREALERCGPFPLAVLPDRLHLVRLAVEGELRQVAEPLWHRRHRAGVSMSSGRQRAASFPGGAPLVAYLPWWLPHAALFLRSLRGRPGRLRLAAVFLRESLRHAHARRRERVRRRRRWRGRERRRRLGRLLARVRPPVQGAPAPPEAASEPGRPGLGEALTALERSGLVRDLRSTARPVVLELASEGERLGRWLTERVPGLELVAVAPAELASAAPGRVDLAVGHGALASLRADELERSLARLHELGVPALFVVEPDSPTLRAALERWYWPRSLWAPAAWAGEAGRKPDPRRGPVPLRPGRPVYLVGRRRLLPEGRPARG